MKIMSDSIIIATTGQNFEFLDLVIFQKSACCVEIQTSDLQFHNGACLQLSHAAFPVKNNTEKLIHTKQERPWLFLGIAVWILWYCGNCGYVCFMVTLVIMVIKIMTGLVVEIFVRLLCFYGCYGFYGYYGYHSFYGYIATYCYLGY
jgi:hypothetical protein